MIPFLCLFLTAAASSWIVVVPVANMHSGPDTAADVVSQAILATTVDELASVPGWRRIRTPDGYEGWVRDSALSPPQEGGYPAGKKSARVDNLFASIYWEPDVTSREPLLIAPYETRLQMVSEPDDEERRWIQVKLPDGRAGWIQRGDVSFDDRPLAVDQVLILARRFQGIPYRWGGTSSLGFDCSGFTQMLCRRRGIQIPRDAAPQAEWDGMDTIGRADLRPGDLLYFGEKPEKVTHAGLYIGGGEFIHATAYKSPTVRISSLTAPRWSALLVACRRLKEPEAK